MLSNEQIDVAVNWWAEAIQNPKQDNGDKSENGFMSSMMMALLVETVTPEQVEAFKSALKDGLEQDERPRLGVDYKPYGLLSVAISLAGISLSNAPIKTEMVFTEGGGVKVSYGYGATFETLLGEIDHG